MIPLEVKRLTMLPLFEEEDVPDYTGAFALADPPSMTLRPIQNKMLFEAKRAGGLVGMVACGEGKTLASFLLPSVLNAKRTLLLIPASMRNQCLSDLDEYRKHWNIRDISVLSYEKLSTPKNKAILEELKPDLIISDEAHHLKHLKSARVRRLEDYLMTSGCRFVALSGTLVSRSIKEYAHLLNWALSVWSPLPRSNDLIDTWARVIEEDQPSRFDKKLHNEGTRRFKGSNKQRLYKRLHTAKGVVLTDTQKVGSTLCMSKRRFKIPDSMKSIIEKTLATQCIVSSTHDVLDSSVVKALFKSRDLWTPQDAVFSRVWFQLIMGFVYFWDWGDQDPDVRWINARRAWCSAVNHCLSSGVYDSEALLIKDLESNKARVSNRVKSAFEEWKTQRHKTPPSTKTLWIDETWIDDVISWAKAQEDPPLIWVQAGAVAQKIHEKTGWTTYGGGAKASQRLNENRGRAHPCVISISAHGTGKNLQAWGNQIIAHPLSHPARWEQMIARTHRAGQERDEVHFTVYTHSLFSRAFRKAVKDAKYIQETTGQKQRIDYCVKI